MLVVALGVVNVLGAEPGEVANLVFGSDKQILSWDAEPMATQYNLYRGYLTELAADFHGVTLEGDLADTSFTDTTEPVASKGFFYLVTASNPDGEGTMGDDLRAGSSTERANTFPWPGRAVAGRWDEPRPWPVVAIHSMMLHTGEVLTWGGGGVPTSSHAWDPASDTFKSSTVNSNIFCSAHSFLADGKAYVTGGTVPLFNGRKTTWTYDPDAGGWSSAPQMFRGRYYPSNVTTGDGTVLIFSGNNEYGNWNLHVERYDPADGGSITLLLGANHLTVIYPTMHLLSDERVFHTGPEGDTETFDPVTETWEFLANTNYGRRDALNSVMLPPGYRKFMILGGQSPGQDVATATAEIIDLSDPEPSWRYTSSMHFPRKHLNTLILPDGRLLVAGGGYDDGTPTHPAEIFDPQTEQWTLLTHMKADFRLYHSTAILLPDGRAMWLGGTAPAQNPTAEFYNPPYLFRGPRPVITSAPAMIGYGETLVIDSPDAPGISSVVLIRPSSTTHSLNMSQRYVPLDFTATGSSIEATAPSEPNVAPPGYYMLWIVDGDGVPSEAEFIQLL